MGPLGWIGLIFVGIALHWTINLTFTSNPVFTGVQPQFGTRSLPQYALYVVAWLLIIIGIVWPATVMSFGFGAVSLLILGMIIHLHRQRESQALLWLLGMAMEKGIPLNRMARAFGNERCDELGTRANHLAGMIESGVSLPDALSALRYRLPAYAQLAVDMDVSTPEAGKLLHNAARQKLQIDIDAGAYIHQILYFAKLLVFAVVTMTFLSIKIAPTLVQIAIDFGVPLSDSMQFALDSIDVIVRYGWVSILFWVVVVYFLIVSILHYLGWSRWEPIIARRWTRRYHASVILQSLAPHARTNRPIHTAIETMGKKYPQRHIRKRLQNAAIMAFRGQPWQTAMVDEGLISRSDANLLNSAERVGNLPWALEETGTAIARRLKYRMMLWMRVVMPMLIIAMAIVIGLCGVSVFSTIRDLVLSING